VFGDTLLECGDRCLHFLEDFVLLEEESCNGEVDIGNLLGQIVFSAAIEIFHFWAKRGLVESIDCNKGVWERGIVLWWSNSYKVIGSRFVLYFEDVVIRVGGLMRSMLW